jgi:alkylation response protein AidB-like acyl-CoA dehydrogenase
MTPYTVDTYDLTPDQVNLQRQVHRFAEEVLRPAAAALDPLPPQQVIAPDSRLWDVFKKTYELGYHLRNFPAQFGGAGLSPLEEHIFSEELGWGSAGLAISLGVASMPFAAALASGHPDLIREVAMPFIEDREAKFIGCWCATEPNHGSDSIIYSGKHSRPDIHLDCTARRDGDEWVISGQKSAWVSNGSIATHTLASVSIYPERGMAGNGSCIIPLNAPGVSRGAPTDKLGQRDLNQGEVFFDEVRIPSHYMLYVPDGTPPAREGLAGPNAFMSSTFTGVARAAFDEAFAYAQTRIQGGGPIARHQLVQKRLFDMFAKVEAARGLSRKAVLRLAAGLPTAHYSIAAKVFCTQTALEVASDAVQLHGASGMVKGMTVERLVRDARAALIEDGANEVLSIAGARLLLGE